MVGIWLEILSQVLLIGMLHLVGQKQMFQTLFGFGNPSTNSYGSFDGTTNTNSVTRYIASGQAFFIQTTGASPILSADEAIKVSNTPSNMFKAGERNSLRMHLIKDATESDEAVVRFMEGKSDEFTYTEDVAKPLMNPNVNISSYFWC
jgi:guanylate kinase